MNSISFMKVWTVVQQKCITTLGKQDKNYANAFETHDILVLQPIEDFDTYEKAAVYIQRFVECPSHDINVKKLSIIERHVVV